MRSEITCFFMKEMFDNLGELLNTITGFDSFSLQPNAGASGEYAGLMVIRAYHRVCHDKFALLVSFVEHSLFTNHMKKCRQEETTTEMSASFLYQHTVQILQVLLCVE